MQATEEVAAAPAPAEASPLDALTAPAATQDEPGASGEQPRAELNAAMNGFLRAGLVGDPTSKPDESDPAGESAPTGDVKPAGEGQHQQPQKPPRRGVPIALETLQTENESLKAQLAERDPEKLRAQWEADLQTQQQQAAEQAKLDELAHTQRANVERYRRLQDTPDAQLSAEDYQWREEFKERLSAFPEVQQFAHADAQRRIEAAEQAHVGGLRSALSRHAGYAGVDRDAFKKLGEWGALGDHLYEAGKRAAQPEIEKRDARIRELEETNRQLSVSGNGGLGAARTLAPAGRSSANVPADGNSTMNGWLRGSS